MNGNLSPADRIYSFFSRDNFKESLCKGSLKFILGKEEHTDTVLACIPDLHSDLLTCGRKERMGDLQQDSYTVSYLAACILTCSVLELFNYGECVIHYGIFGNAVDLDYSTDSAGIMFSVV